MYAALRGCECMVTWLPDEELILSKIDGSQILLDELWLFYDNYICLIDGRAALKEDCIIYEITSDGVLLTNFTGEKKLVNTKTFWEMYCI